MSMVQPTQIYRPLVILQPTTFCNIDCKYCYLPARSQKDRLSLEAIRRIATEIFSSSRLTGEVLFVWHLGEPLTVPISYYTAAFAEIDRISQQYHRQYVQTFQTNATLLNDDWIRFIIEHRVRIGVSLDGPAFIHDRQRVRRNGRGTHTDVCRGIRLLQAHDIPFGVISVVTDFTLDYPDEYFAFFHELGVKQIGFNIDEIEGVHTTTSFTRDASIQRYKRFFARLLELADETHGGIKFREAWTNLRKLLLGVEAYNLTNKPFRILNFDARGNFSTFCPELVAATSEKYHDFIMGNILTDSLESIFENPTFQQVHQEIEAGLTLCKATCPYWDHCGGGEPSSKFFEHGRFDVSETTTCRVHKQATVDVLIDYLETKAAAPAQVLEMLQSPES